MKKFEVSPETQIPIEEQHHSQDEKRKTTARKTKQRKEHAKIIKKHFPHAKTMLCMGCRDNSEVADFIKHGFRAIGIDVANETNLIHKMDAHKMCDHFKNQFDIVYSSHSLEHMYDAKLVMESIRKLTKKGIYIILPKGGPRKNGGDPGTPSINHPSIFDIMYTNKQTLEEIQAHPELLSDFDSLGNIKLVYFKLTSQEVHLLFRFM